MSPGVAVSINVGPSADGADAGDFYLNEGEPNAGLATTAMLQFSAETDSTGGVEVVRDANGVLLQVVSPESFCHLTTTSAYAYQLAVYHPGAKGTWNGTTYAVNVGTNLISTWTIENPDVSPTVFNRLKITESPNGGSSRVWTYAYTNATQVWSLALPGGLGEERASQTVDGSGVGSRRSNWSRPTAPSGSSGRPFTRTSPGARGWSSTVPAPTGRCRPTATPTSIPSVTHPGPTTSRLRPPGTPTAPGA